MNAIQKHLEPVQQKLVKFQGDSIPAVKVEGGQVYVPIRPICDFLGLQFSAQSKRLRRDDILSDVMEHIEIQTQSGTQSMVCLPVEFLNGWLFGIQSARVKAEYRDKIREYKFSCYYTLAGAFSPKALGPHDGPSIGLGITLRLADDFNDLRAYVTDKQTIMEHEQQGTRQMVSQLKAKVSQLEALVEKILKEKS